MLSFSLCFKLSQNVWSNICEISWVIEWVSGDYVGCGFAKEILVKEIICFEKLHSMSGLGWPC